METHPRPHELETPPGPQRDQSCAAAPASRSHSAGSGSQAGQLVVGLEDWHQVDLEGHARHSEPAPARSHDPKADQRINPTTTAGRQMAEWLRRRRRGAGPSESAAGALRVPREPVGQRRIPAGNGAAAAASGGAGRRLERVGAAMGLVDGVEDDMAARLGPHELKPPHVRLRRDDARPAEQLPRRWLGMGESVG